MAKFLILTTELESNGGIQRYTRLLIRTLVEMCGPNSVRTVSYSAVGGQRAEVRSQKPEARSEKRRAKSEEQRVPSNCSPLSALRSTPYAHPASCFLRLASCVSKLRFILSSVYRAAQFHPDLVICNHIALGPVALILKRLFGLKYLVLAYGIEVWGNVSRRLFDEAAAVITISRFTARVLREKHGVDERKIRFLRVAIEPDLTKQPVACDDVINRHKLQGKRVLLTVGRMMSHERYKGHEVVIRSLVSARKVIPDLVYLIVGDGDDRARLENLARGLGLQETVVFAGSVEDQWLPAYYQASDAFIMPSRTEDGQKCAGEGFGIVYIEAAAFGKPAIAGKHGGSAEAVEEGVTGILVDPTSVDEVAGAIVTLFTNNHLRQTLGQQAQARALREFTIDRFRRNLESILTTSTSLVIGH